jgi:group I intron endonuclease
LDKICGIYCITNKINGKKYIGQSINIKERWHSEKQNRGNNKHLTRAMEKYGRENFDFSIIEECPKELLDTKEEEYIKKFNSNNVEFGYNIAPGGKKFNTWWEKLSQEQKEELNRQRSLSLKGRKMKLTQKQRQEMSERMKKRVKEKRKKVYCLETNKIYESVSDAAKENGILDDILVSRCCSGKYKSTNNLHFCFAEDKEAKIWDLKTPAEKSKEVFGKKIVCIELNREFTSIREAVRELKKSGFKVYRDGISKVINGKQETVCGLHFKEACK